MSGVVPKFSKNPYGGSFGGKYETLNSTPNKEKGDYYTGNYTLNPRKPPLNPKVMVNY